MLIKKIFVFILLSSFSIISFSQNEDNKSREIIGIMSLDFADYVIQKHIVLSYEAFFQNNRFSLNPEFSISREKAPYLSSNGNFENWDNANHHYLYQLYKKDEVGVSFNFYPEGIKKDVKYFIGSKFSFANYNQIYQPYEQEIQPFLNEVKNISALKAFIRNGVMFFPTSKISLSIAMGLGNIFFSDEVMPPWSNFRVLSISDEQIGATIDIKLGVIF